MNRSILVQKQVKDNAEDLQKEFLDMKNWEEQMKRKDEELKKEASDQVTLPPIRSKFKKKTKGTTKENDVHFNSKRIKSYDYSAWDKFDVDKACKDIDKKQEDSSDSEGEVMTKEELEKVHDEALEHKNEGNVLVQKKQWVEAIKCYNEAIKLFPYDAVFYANRAFCQLKLDNLHSVESDCSTAIQLDETYVKAYHRRAIARMNLKQYKEAKQDLEKILALEHSNKEAKLLLSQIESKIKPPEMSTVAKRDMGESIEQLTLEKKIAKKMWGDSTSSLGSQEGIKDVEKTKEDKDMIRDISSRNTTEDKKDDEKVDDVGKGEKDLRIPDWLPERDNVAVIELIDKPPHLRSKKLMTKVLIKEVDLRTLELDEDFQKMLHNESKTVLKTETSKVNNVKNENICVKILESSEDLDNIPTIPKTAVEFAMIWKGKSVQFRYKYLKQISISSLGRIFQESMEPDVLSQILEILRIEFIKNKDPVFCFLKELCEIRRFNALVMFLSSADRENLKVLFEHIKIIENISEREISVLRGKYEM